MKKEFPRIIGSTETGNIIAISEDGIKIWKIANPNRKRRIKVKICKKEH